MINLNSLNTIKFVQDKKIADSQPNKGVMNPFVTKPDTFEKTTKVNFTGKSNRIKEYKKTVEALKLTADNAQTSLNGRLASDGWAGKLADKISVLWRSKNRANLVQTDIDAYKKQVQELEDSIKEDKFTQKFEETFGVKYNRANITKYEKKSRHFNVAVNASCAVDIMKEKLSKPLEVFNKNYGELREQYEVRPNYLGSFGNTSAYINKIPKEYVFQTLEKPLAECLGGKEILDLFITASGVDKDKSTPEQKYKAYGILAEYLLQSAEETKKKTTNGKSLKELKAECEEAYQNAYGTKNNIQDRVNKYNRSQEISTAAVKGVTRTAVSSAIFFVNPVSGISKIVMSTAVSAGTKVVADSTDKLTSDKGLSSQNVKDIIRGSAMGVAEKIASTGLSALIPGIDTGSEILNFIIDQANAAAQDTAVGIVFEKLNTGNWATNQIVPRMLMSAVFRNLTPDDELAKQIRSLTKSGIEKATLKSLSLDKNIVKNFVEGTKTELEKGYERDQKLYKHLKDMADKNPEEYEKLMTEVLESEIMRNLNQKKKENNKKA